MVRAGKNYNVAPVMLEASLVLWSLEAAFHYVVLHSNHGEKPIEFASPTSTSICFDDNYLTLPPVESKAV